MWRPSESIGTRVKRDSYLHRGLAPAVDWVCIGLAVLQQIRNSYQHAVGCRDVHGRAKVVVRHVGAAGQPVQLPSESIPHRQAKENGKGPCLRPFSTNSPTRVKSPLLA